MAEEKTLDALAYEGAILNLMGESLTIASKEPISTWPTFVVCKEIPPVRVGIEAPIMKLPSELRHGDPKSTVMLLPEDKVGLDCEVEPVGMINSVFRLVKPVTPCRELVEMWQKNIKAFPTVRLTHVPPKTTSKFNRGMQRHYVVSYNVACVGAIRHHVRQEELARWLIPVEPRDSSARGIIGYQSFIPASFLLTEELLAETVECV